MITLLLITMSTIRPNYFSCHTMSGTMFVRQVDFKFLSLNGPYREPPQYNTPQAVFEFRYLVKSLSQIVLNLEKRNCIFCLKNKLLQTNTQIVQYYGKVKRSYKTEKRQLQQLGHIRHHNQRFSIKKCCWLKMSNFKQRPFNVILFKSDVNHPFQTTLLFFNSL